MSIRDSGKLMSSISDIPIATIDMSTTGNFGISKSLNPETIKLIEQALSPATLRAYQSDLREFESYCRDREVLTFDNPACSRPEFIADWIAYRIKNGYRVSTVTRGLSALRSLYPDTAAAVNSPIVRAAVRGARRNQSSAGRAVKSARPITPSELDRMCAAWNKMTSVGSRNIAFLRLGWLGAMRISELCALRYDDIAWSTEGLQILIRKSKTDQNGDGCLIGIPNCSWISDIRSWCERCHFLQQTSGAVFFPRFRRGVGSQYQASIIERDSLSIRGARDIFYRSAQAAGIISVSPHSFRSGMITFAASIGVPERLIAAHSRHASLRVLRGYIQRGSIWQDNALDLVVRRLDSSIVGAPRPALPDLTSQPAHTEPKHE